MVYTLYKGDSAWGLPSYLASSIQLEAYLRLAKADLAAESRRSASASPSGQLPALEDENGLEVPFTTAETTEFDTARQLIDILKQRGLDLDRQLSGTQKAHATAFTALIQLSLEPATLWTTWGEWESFSKHVRPIAGADVAFPLNYVTTWSQRKQALRQLPNLSADEIFEAAARCYVALAAHLDTSRGNFFLGDSPSSVDAYLYGHLAIHLRAPVSAPELRKAVEAHPSLVRYAERMAEHFEAPLPAPPPPSGNEQWKERTTQNGKRPGKKRAQTQAEKDHQFRNWLWCGGALAAGAAYVLFSGQVIDYELEELEEEVEED